MSIAKLTAFEAVTRQAITKHLRTMEEAGLVESQRHGRESVWELSPRRLGEARRYLDLVASRWDAALRRLKVLVEEDQA